MSPALVHNSALEPQRRPVVLRNSGCGGSLRHIRIPVCTHRDRSPGSWSKLHVIECDRTETREGSRKTNLLHSIPLGPKRRGGLVFPRSAVSSFLAGQLPGLPWPRGRHCHRFSGHIRRRGDSGHHTGRGGADTAPCFLNLRIVRQRGFHNKVLSWTPHRRGSRQSDMARRLWRYRYPAGCGRIRG